MRSYIRAAMLGVAFGLGLLGVTLVKAGLESATFVSSLVSTNPLSTDPQGQGDDHLRLIKSVLQSTFPNASKAFRFPTALSTKTAEYTVLSTDDNAIIPVSTASGGFDVNLPSLSSGDAGWSVTFVKTNNSSNPIFLVPPSGTINGFAYVRRSVANIPIRVVWTGSTYYATRAWGVPIGTIVPFFSSSTPDGTLLPDGNSFSSGDYLELFTALGSTTKPDLRGRVPFMLDGSANRLTAGAGGVNGDTLGADGGLETRTIAQVNLPSYTLPNTLGISGSHSHTYTRFNSQGTIFFQSGASSVADVWFGSQATSTSSDATGASISGGVTSGGSGTALATVPPALVTNYLIIAE